MNYNTLREVRAAGEWPETVAGLRRLLDRLTDRLFANRVSSMTFQRKWHPLLVTWFDCVLHPDIVVRQDPIKGLGIYCTRHCVRFDVKIPGICVEERHAGQFPDIHIHSHTKILLGPIALLNHSAQAHYSLPAIYLGKCMAKWKRKRTRRVDKNQELCISYSGSFAKNMNAIE